MKGLILLLLIISITIPNINAQIPQPRDPQSCPDFEMSGVSNTCERDRLESSKEVKFVNAYFGSVENINSLPARVEVAPNDGITNLIVVLANNGHFELAGLRGWLTLPAGFESIDGKNIAFDTYDLNIKSGDTFYLEFPVNIKKTKIGLYDANLYIEYFRVREQGLQFRNMDIQFRVTGKNILDAYSTQPILALGNNEVEINIINKGSVQASSMMVNLSSDTLIIIDDKTLSLGTIEPNKIITIKPKIYVNPNLANSIQQLNIMIEYFNSYGEKENKNIPIVFMIEGSSTNIIFSLSTDKNTIQILKEEVINIKIKNNGYEEAKNVEILVSNPIVQPQSRQKLSIIGDGFYLIDRIKPNEEISISLKLFATEDASRDVFELPITISYIDSNGGKYVINRMINIYAQGAIILRMYDVSLSMIGNVPNVSGFLLNEGTDTALFTTIELIDTNGSQYIGDLDPNSPTPFAIALEGKELNTINLKVTYKDELRNTHEVILTSDIKIMPLQQEVKVERQDQTITYILATMASIGAISIYVIIKRKKKTGI